MKYVDLSHNILSEMPVYPGDSGVSLEKVRDFDKVGYNAYEFNGGMHCGTHIDCPMHMINETNYISDYGIERFIGNGVLLDVRGESIITLKEDYFKKIKENDIVLLYTGYDKVYGNEEYYTDHPVISEELAEFLVRKGIKLIGFDMPSPDREPYIIHNTFLKNNIFILENVTNLGNLLYVEEFEVCALPLKICAEASLVRAFAYYKGY